MKIILGADHGGWQMKEEIRMWLTRLRQGYGEGKDMGAIKQNPNDDYVDFAVLVAKELDKDGEAKGLLFCRNGIGMVITANRFGGVRCGVGFNVQAVEKGRSDDDINCLAIPSEYVSLEMVKEMIEVFLKTEFKMEERYERRLLKLGLIK